MISLVLRVTYTKNIRNYNSIVLNLIFSWLKFSDAINLRTRGQHFYGRFVIGNKDSKCCYCNAIMWKEEKVENSPNVQPIFSVCCGSGQISLNLLPRTLDYLASKLEDYRFKEHIRMYNSMLSFTSIGAHFDRSVTHGRGPYTF